MDPLNFLIGLAALALILGLIFGRRRPSTTNAEQAPSVEPEKQPEPNATPEPQEDIQPESAAAEYSDEERLAMAIKRRVPPPSPVCLTTSVTFSPDDFTDGLMLEFVQPATSGGTGWQGPAASVLAAPGVDLARVIKTQTEAGRTLLQSVKFAKARPVTASAADVCLRPMDISKVVITEMVTAVYGGDGLPDTSVSESVSNAEDVLVCGAESGRNASLLPSLDIDSAIAASALNAAPFRWPVLMAGRVAFHFALEESVTCRAPLPGDRTGYNPKPKSITVQIRVGIFGMEILDA